MTRKTKITILVSASALLLAVLSVWIFSVLQSQMKMMDSLKILSSNPGSMDPMAVVNRIDSSFSSLSEDEKKRIAADPKLLSERIRSASYQNYQKAFGELFMLPEPVRRKIIKHSAASIASSIEKNPAKVDAFYESEAGKAALSAASEFFLTALDSKEKSELKPITEAFFKVHKDRVARGKN